jgi:uncharacterized protein (DUF433 family)
MHQTFTLESDLQERIEALAAAMQATPGEVLRALVTEALKMRECPGIVFADGPAGRSAVIAGSGIEVWAVAEVWRECQPDFACLRRSFDMLTDAQLRAALGYYQRYPEEIDTWIARNAQAAEELERAHAQGVKRL